MKFFPTLLFSSLLLLTSIYNISAQTPLQKQYRYNTRQQYYQYHNNLQQQYYYQQLELRRILFNQQLIAEQLRYWQQFQYNNNLNPYYYTYPLYNPYYHSWR